MASARLKELDALRGVAIVCMVVYHVVYQLNYFELTSVPLRDFPFDIFARCVQVLFIGLVGISVFLSSRGFTGQLKRSALLALCAGLISLVTWWVDPEMFVRFGILHLIAVLLPIFVLLKKCSSLFVLGLVLITFLITPFLRELRLDTEWLLPFGIRSEGFQSFDYFALFPWMGVGALGLLIGRWVYAERRDTPLVILARIPGLVFLGRHSLFIYMMHHPLIFGILSLVVGTFSF